MVKFSSVDREQKEACASLYRKLLVTLDKENYDVILNTLVFVVADFATDVQDIDKHEFMEKVMQQLNDAYDACLLHKAKVQGGTQ